MLNYAETPGSMAGRFLLFLAKISLFVITGTLSVSFLTASMPPGREFVAYGGLAAMDGGVLLWEFAHNHAARGSGQRGIAMIMIGVDWVAVLVTVIVAALNITGAKGLTDKLDAATETGAVIFVYGVILINAGAMVLWTVFHPNNMEHAADDGIAYTEWAASLKGRQHAAQTSFTPIVGAAHRDATRRAAARYGFELGPEYTAPQVAPPHAPVKVKLVRDEATGTVKGFRSDNHGYDPMEDYKRRQAKKRANGIPHQKTRIVRDPSGQVGFKSEIDAPAQPSRLGQFLDKVREAFAPDPVETDPLPYPDDDYLAATTAPDQELPDDYDPNEVIMIGGRGTPAHPVAKPETSGIALPNSLRRQRTTPNRTRR